MEQLYHGRGERIYLAERERNRFLKAARSTATPIRALCEILAFTGRRVSETRALTPEIWLAVRLRKVGRRKTRGGAR